MSGDYVFPDYNTKPMGNEAKLETTPASGLEMERRRSAAWARAEWRRHRTYFRLGFIAGRVTQAASSTGLVLVGFLAFWVVLTIARWYVR